MHTVIAVLPGDGIGPEVIRQAVRVLDAVAERFGHSFSYIEALIGGAAVDATGDPIPKPTLDVCRNSSAILLGAVGGPQWDNIKVTARPEQGLLRLRRELGLYANVRPVMVHPSLIDHAPLRPELLADVDMVVVRELTRGIYFGEKTEGTNHASDTCSYTAAEVERITRFACDIAVSRGGRITSVDKANVLATSRLWRATVEGIVRTEYPQIELDHLLVDAAAMHLIQDPSRFDVLLTENMFGDILSDESSVLAGSMGMLPSASIGADGAGLFEPIHGSAPDLAGQNIANPYASILSAAMLLELSLGLERESRIVYASVDAAIARGARTPDLVSEGGVVATTREVGDAVVESISRCNESAGYQPLQRSL